jgi:methylated-DNA-[protein]-cysteine S-methyltransferase
MLGNLEYTAANTSLGWIAIMGSASGLLDVTLPRPSSQEALKLLGEMTNYATWSPDRFEDVVGRLRRFLSRQRVDFADKLDLSRATPFQREVWRITRLIPYGETRSYSWVAKQTGKPGAARAVGQALARNRLAVIIPCHRVVGSSHKLCGFSGGLKLKRQLLRLEAATLQ